MKKQLKENTKITLTYGQLKRLVSEADDSKIPLDHLTLSEKLSLEAQFERLIDKCEKLLNSNDTLNDIIAKCRESIKLIDKIKTRKDLEALQKKLDGYNTFFDGFIEAEIKD